MRTFRLLKANEIECRIKPFKSDGKSDAKMELLLYKTARTDAALLDETYGAMNWKNEYRMVDGKLYCGLSIRNPDDTNEWITKWNVGTESNVESEKGQASDAMKRAGFVWGLGAELYTAPKVAIDPYGENIHIKVSKSGWVTCADRLTVGEIEYNEENEISKLVILANDKPCFVWPSDDKQESAVAQPVEGISKPSGDDVGRDTKNEARPAERHWEGEYRCSKCGRVIEAHNRISRDKILNRSNEEFKVPLCYDCLEMMIACKINKERIEQ